MPQTFLVEIGTEELPPKALKKLADAFCDSIAKELKTAGLEFAELNPFATPRRLAALIKALPEKTPIKKTKQFGPPAKIAFDSDGKPTKAAIAFAKKNSLALDNLKTESDGKVEKLVAEVSTGGETSAELLPQVIINALTALPIDKRMRWGATRNEFVRPVQWLAMMLDDKVIDCEIMGIKSGNLTRGHRFHSQGNIAISHAENYPECLAEQGHVIADYEKRKELIRKQIQTEGEKLNGRAVIDEELLDEVTSLVEFPVTLSGRFEENFLQVPQEALISSMKEHQKYFHVIDDSDALLPNFITVSNIESLDPQKIVEGNEKVIRPRLADAAFFFNEDKKTPLAARVERLKSIVFQAQLGTSYDKTERITKLALSIARAFGMSDSQNVDKVKRTALLSKTDLVTSMVYEFPELQGTAGRYYAIADGENAEVAAALEEQYLPKFAGDDIPPSKLGACIALADRIDTLVGIFGLGKKHYPTGSKDAFGLRRAALAILRIIIEKEVDLDLKTLFNEAFHNYSNLPNGNETVPAALNYTLDRLRSYYEERAISVKIFYAVAAKNLSQPVDINKRMYAVAKFAALPEAGALAAANKRVSNILSKQDNVVQTEVNHAALVEEAERELATQLAEKTQHVLPYFESRDYASALASLADLRQPVDRFFDDVMVMVDDENLKNNRLALLFQLRNLFLKVADISALAVAK